MMIVAILDEKSIKINCLGLIYQCCVQFNVSWLHQTTIRGLIHLVLYTLVYIPAFGVIFWGACI